MFSRCPCLPFLTADLSTNNQATTKNIIQTLSPGTQRRGQVGRGSLHLAGSRTPSDITLEMFDRQDGYRERKEAFVSDLTGTSMAELLLVCTPIPVGLWLLAEAKVCVLPQESQTTVQFCSATLSKRTALAQLVAPALSYHVLEMSYDIFFPT